ncbi:MAG: hypothetical protein ACLPZM_09790 [Thermoplasmata archaeon]
MSAPARVRPELPVPSMTATTVRRAIAVGWRYLAIGTGVSLVLAVILVVSARSQTSFPLVFPVELPLFCVMGSLGGLMTFTSDRTKGVFEYLIAYGVRARSLFLDGLVATAALVAIILALSLGVGLGAAAVKGIPLNEDFLKTVALYTVPMAFAAGLFTSTVGMIWSSVSSPRSGINSPLGLAPTAGIAPTILVLIVADSAPSADFYYITTGAAVTIIAVVVGLLALSARLMGRERFLSPL